MKYFVITSDYGRIGPLWWFNSNTQIHPIRVGFRTLLVVEWGTCGSDHDFEVEYQVVGPAQL
jgi:hypothetical protein